MLNHIHRAGFNQTTFHTQFVPCFEDVWTFCTGVVGTSTLHRVPNEATSAVPIDDMLAERLLQAPRAYDRSPANRSLALV